MVIIDIFICWVLDCIELYSKDMIGSITIVGLIEKAKVLVWKASWPPSSWRNHESYPISP